MKKILLVFLVFTIPIGCTLSDPEMLEVLMEIKGQNEKLKQEIESMKTQLAALDGKYQVVMASLADNKKELEVLKGQIEALKGQLTQQLEKINQLTAQLEKQGADIEKLTAEIAELKSSCAELIKLFENQLNTCCYTESFQWRKLMVMDFIGVSPYSFDKERRRIYFLNVNKKYLKFYSLDENSFGNITVFGFPNFDREGTSIFNPKTNTIQFWRSGRDKVYEVSRDGGQIKEIASGSFDATLYGSNPIYNGITNNVAIMNGYGFFSVKNSVYEVSGASWTERRPNSSSQPYKRSSAFVYPNKDYSKAYLFSGQGNISGAQQESSCTIPNVFSWPSDVGKYCWLTDIWEIDLKTWEVKNVLQLGSNFEATGNFGYDYIRGIFYSFGGFAPASISNQPVIVTNNLRKLDPKKDSAWVTISYKG